MSALGFTGLKTARLLIRFLRRDDLRPFLEYHNDLEVARYQSWQTPLTEAEVQSFIETQQTLQPGVPGQPFYFALELAKSGQLIGDCTFTVFTYDDQQAMFGITIAQEHQRQGFGLEAGKAILKYAFRNFTLQRICTTVYPENLSAIVLIERLGLQRLTTQPDDSGDLLHLYAITRSAWQRYYASFA